ncbi:MAG TPA: hypothetical protein VLI06_15190 [Solimonas sp.]|nr:hypothetical protein [Solimonas sp.]
MNRHYSLHAILFATALGLGLGATACKKQEEQSGMESAKENVQDALNTRPNEELKDAGEDAKSAMENLGDAAEKKADEIKQN